MFDNEHANQGSQCSSVPTYTFVVHNAALYGLSGAQDDFACSLSIFIMVYNAVLSVSVYVCNDIINSVHFVQISCILHTILFLKPCLAIRAGRSLIFGLVESLLTDSGVPGQLTCQTYLHVRGRWTHHITGLLCFGDTHCFGYTHCDSVYQKYFVPWHNPVRVVFLHSIQSSS